MADTGGPHTGGRSMTTVVQAAAANVLEGMHVKRVFGEPIERDGAWLIPAAKVRGGGGGRRRYGGQRGSRVRHHREAGRHVRHPRRHRDLAAGPRSEPRDPRRPDRGHRRTPRPAIDPSPTLLTLFDRRSARHYHGRSRGGAVVARRAHNPKVGGSNPSPATTRPASSKPAFGPAFVHPLPVQCARLDSP